MRVRQKQEKLHRHSVILISLLIADLLVSLQIAGGRCEHRLENESAQIGGTKN